MPGRNECNDDYPIISRAVSVFLRADTTGWVAQGQSIANKGARDAGPNPAPAARIKTYFFEMNEEMNTMQTHYPPTRAFRKGLGLLRAKDVKEAKNGIMEILGVYSAPSFAAYADGLRSLDIEKAHRLEVLFASYGVESPWGEN